MARGGHRPAARIPVVRLDAQRSATTIGWCDAMWPAPRPPCFVRVMEPVQIGKYLGEVPLPVDIDERCAVFEVIEVRTPGAWGVDHSEPAILATSQSRNLEWLPGWRPA